MKNLYTYFFIFALINLTACGSITGLSNNNLNDVADETEVESAFTAAVDTINANSDSSSLDDASAADSSTGYAAATASSATRTLFHCEDPTTVTSTFECDADTNMTALRTVTFAGCVVSNSYFSDMTITGSFNNSWQHISGGCGDDHVDLPEAIFGAHESNTAMTHTGEIVRSFTTHNGLEATIMAETSRTVGFYDAIDANDDDLAEAVDLTVSQNATITRNVGDVELVEQVSTPGAGSFEAVDTDGNPLTVETVDSLHSLTFDADTHLITTRTINTGNLRIDHYDATGELAFVLLFGVGEDGLTFDLTTETCGPENGTMTVQRFLNVDDVLTQDDDGTGSITYVDGVATATFAGEELNIRPRPCQ